MNKTTKQQDNNISTTYWNIFNVAKIYAPSLLRSKTIYIFLLVLSMLSIFSGLIPLALPYLSSIVVDEAIPNGSIKLFGLLAASAGILYFLKIIINISSTYVNVICETYVQKTLREHIFNRMIEAPMSVQRTHAFGDISRRIIDDIETYSIAIVETIPTLIGQIFMFIILCIIIAKLNFFLLVLMAISIPSILIINMAAGHKFRPLFSIKEQVRDKQVNTINLATEGFVWLISFGVIKKIKKIFKETLDKEVDLRLKEWRISAFKSNGEWFFANGIGAIALWSAWFLSLKDVITLGGAVAAIMYFALILVPVVQIAGVIRNIIAATIASGRLLEPIEFLSESNKNEKIIHLPRNHGKVICLKDVNFQYPQAISPILNKICLEIPDGSVIGLGGPSGGGKTTLGKLISGHFKPTQGNVEYFSKHKAVTINHHIPSRILYVPEDPFILSDSIKNNITFFSGDCDSEKLQRCIRDACFTNVITKLPDGIDTQLGGSKTDLSKGQKQRLLIARSLYAASGRMIVFDESTSNLDPDLEWQVLSNLKHKALEENISIFLISHREKVMQQCDIIYHLTDSGHLKLRGTSDKVFLKEELKNA